MLKIMVIPAKETKSAAELIDIFVKVYDSLLKTAKPLEYESLFKLINDHMETAFKMTSRVEFHLKQRAFQWLETIVEVAPLKFWADRKRRVIKSLYTHALDNIKLEIAGANVCRDQTHLRVN